MRSVSIAIAVVITMSLGACFDGLEETGPTYSIPIPFGLNFTPDEKNVWNQLNDEQRLRAIEFIKNGGTLISSLNVD